MPIKFRNHLPATIHMISEKGLRRRLPPFRFFHRNPLRNMSLSQRLKMVQVQTTVEVASLDHLTLDELASEIVTFGAKHQGKSYQDVWADQEWVQFMVARYQSSTKEAHRRFLKYVELKVEELENQQHVVPPTTSVTTKSGNTKPKAKSKSLAKASMPTFSPDGDEGWDMEPEMYMHETTGIAGLPLTEEMHAMQQRMLHMEDALGRVITYIEDQATKEKIHQHAP